MTHGTVGILNVGAGDVELRFDNNNPAETIRAGRIVKDMIRRGYALLVEVDRDGEKKFERALDFDEKTNCYWIADFDPIPEEQRDAMAAAEREAGWNEEAKPLVSPERARVYKDETPGASLTTVRWLQEYILRSKR